MCLSLSLSLSLSSSLSLSLFFGPVMSPHYSDQMSQRSLGSLCSVVKTLIVGGARRTKGARVKVTY